MKGATPRKKVRIKINWFNYIKPVSISVSLLSIVVAAILLLLQLVNKNIDKLELVASFEHVSELQVKQQIHGVFPAGFISLEVVEIQQRLEQLVMVSSAQVEKVWPDTLKISLTEEAPVAIWNEQSMLNQQGNILPIAFKDLQLPLLKGDDSNMVMQHFLLFKRFAKLHQLDLIALDYSASGWLLEHNNGLRIRLDGSTAMQGLKTLETVIDQFKLARIASIDMRYEQGFAVAWKETVVVQ